MRLPSVTPRTILTLTNLPRLLALGLTRILGKYDCGQGVLARAIRPLLRFPSPWIDYAGQATLLESRGLTIADRSAAESFSDTCRDPHLLSQVAHGWPDTTNRVRT